MIKIRWIAFAVLAVSWGTASLAVGPRPMGSTTVEISYPTPSGSGGGSSTHPFTSVFPANYAVLEVTPTLWEFNSVDFWGRRANVSVFDPSVIRENETIITHSFYKLDPAHTQELFPGLNPGGSVTVNVGNVQFDRPVEVIEETFLFHTFWDLNQADLLMHPYEHPHNLHTLATEFRDAAAFYAAHEFADPPHEHQVFGDIAGMIQILGEGTDTLSISATIPYALFRHLHEEGHPVPEGLPAPQGFLEPYHFHLEYVVRTVPEPSALLLMLPAAWLLRSGKRMAKSERQGNKAARQNGE